MKQCIVTVDDDGSGYDVDNVGDHDYNDDGGSCSIYVLIISIGLIHTQPEKSTME